MHLSVAVPFNISCTCCSESTCKSGYANRFGISRESQQSTGLTGRNSCRFLTAWTHIYFFLCFFQSVLWKTFKKGEKKKRSQVAITCFYWWVASTFIASGDSWLLILSHVKPDSSMDQFKLVWGGFAICLPDPALPPSFQYFEPHFLYNS